VRRDANFEAATKLPHPPGFLVFTDGLRDTKSMMGTIVVAAKDSTTARPDIRRKTGTRNRIAQCQCPKHSTDGMAVAAMREFGDPKLLDVVSAAMCQAKAFDSNAEITAKEIFGIEPTTPSVIATTTISTPRPLLRQ
jgi:hypothetical protein